ncbi:hypothetical protein BDN72DRAFT_777748 [Pluteus cervinus]|uniref:Uncharacterized protein n=1 Tax=Pluteus cervinus TaxID=181527 RepID=A0ACD3A872_9AGAR|nr:hypothetical protein BDN72DRAFT_777748 [Pluteus cervinus]
MEIAETRTPSTRSPSRLLASEVSTGSTQFTGRKIPRGAEYVEGERITQLPGEGANTSLLRRGLLGSAPDYPNLSFTIELLEIYHQLRRRQSNFSVQAFTKTFCSIHNRPYTNILRQQFSDAFDIYLDILRRVKARVDDALQQSDSDWRIKNSCPACSYKCPDEPELMFSRLHALDGNNSLKRFDGAKADEREFTSNYFLSNEYVDKFKDDVHNARKNPSLLPPSSTTAAAATPPPTTTITPDNLCVDTWHAATTVSEDTVKVFDQTGVFLSACRHRIVESMAEMRKSGELAKYGLAVVNSHLDTFGKSQLEGYDIGCAFQKTTDKSSIGPKARELNLQYVVDSFHGHAHNRPCQLNNHPLYRVGVGLEDFGTCERIFSSSNSAARLIRHSSYFHWKQFIDLHFMQWDEDRYEELSNFLLNNYKQALRIITSYTPVVDKLKEKLKISDGDFLRWIEEEKAYLASLSKKEKIPQDAVSYVTRLSALEAFEYQEKKARDTARLRDRLRLKIDMQRDAVEESEVFLGIDARWTKAEPRYQEVAKYIANSNFVQAVEKVEGLVVQRLLELAKANLAETGYKQRQHISHAITNRSGAIRTAIGKYNELALLQNPPCPELEIKTILSYSLLGEFELLKHSRVDILSKPWSVMANRETASKYFKVCRAREEIIRLNVEIRRLEAWVEFEDNHLKNTVASLRVTDPLLAIQVEKLYERRQRLNSKHQKRLSKVYMLGGFTGTYPDRSIMATTIEEAKADKQEEELEVGEDDVMVDEALRLRDFVENVSS